MIHFFVSTKPSIASKVAMVTIMEVILWLLAVSRVSQEHSKLLHLQDGFTASMIACSQQLIVVSTGVDFEVTLGPNCQQNEAAKCKGGIPGTSKHIKSSSTIVCVRSEWETMANQVYGSLVST